MQTKYFFTQPNETTFEQFKQDRKDQIGFCTDVGNNIVCYSSLGESVFCIWDKLNNQAFCWN